MVLEVISVEIEAFQDFQEFLQLFPQDGKYFRGQHDAQWGLISHLERDFNPRCYTDSIDLAIITNLTEKIPDFRTKESLPLGKGNSPSTFWHPHETLGFYAKFQDCRFFCYI